MDVSHLKTSRARHSKSLTRMLFSRKLKLLRDADRFIPSRSARDTELQFHAMNQQRNEQEEKLSSNKMSAHSRYKELLISSLFEREGQIGKARVLSFCSKAPKPPVDYQNTLRQFYIQNRELQPRSHQMSRQIATSAESVLDAPDLLDQFYANLLDWSSENVLAVGLGRSLYIRDMTSGHKKLLLTTPEENNFITSVQWMQSGTHVAIGTTQQEVQLWDVAAQKKVRSMRGHARRVSSLAWNGHILSSGSRDAEIFNHDVRIAKHHFQTFSGHHKEVCGLKWSLDGSKLASGGNDNVCAIWSLSNSAPKFSFTDHTAGVKALAWSPHSRNLLASGGGIADRHIRFWNTSTGTCLSSIDTKSQVCGLIWNPYEKELLSAHGYWQNQLTLWKYPTLHRTAELTGHTSRVLHMTLSPDGTTVCSAAADETLRFWKVFEPVSKTPPASPTRGRRLIVPSIR